MNPSEKLSGLVHVHPRLPVIERRVTPGILLALWHPTLGEWAIGLLRDTEEPLHPDFPSRKAIELNYAGNKFACVLSKADGELHILDAISQAGDITIRYPSSSNTSLTERRIVRLQALSRHEQMFCLREVDITIHAGTQCDVQYETTGDGRPLPEGQATILWRGSVLATMSFEEARDKFIGV